MDIRKTLAAKITGPLVPFLSKTNLSPNTVTWIGFAIIIIATGFIALDYFLIGGILVLVAGLFDILDGALARYANKSTLFGAVLDSTLDRLSEALILFGIFYQYLNSGGHTLEIYLIFGVMVGSFLISYIKARAEGLDIECNTGLFTRAERVIILALGLIFNLVLMVLLILAVFTCITVVQRLVHVWQRAKKQVHKK